MTKSTVLLAGLLSLFAASSFAQGASAPAAGGSWAKNHPRRAEVNARLANQNRRIHHEVKDGQIGKGQAAKLHSQDHQIRQEERDMARQDGGHITKQEKTTLNQQENAVSKKIGP